LFWNKRRIAPMLARTWLPALACALLVASGAEPADEKKAPEGPAEMAVRLKLNAIETSKLLEHYETLVKRELGLQDNVRACIKSGDNRVPQYQQALQEAQDDLDATRKKLVALEVEKRKLTAQLGRKDLPDHATEPLARANQALAKILERLTDIEKRLEKIERQK
jgi:hypothetical protein